MTRSLALLCFALAGCTEYDPCFEPPSLVRDARILAVRAEPPESLYDPVTFQSSLVRVTALVVEADTTVRPFALEGFICAPTDDGRCPEGPPAVAYAIGDQDALPELAFEVPPELVRAALAADALAGYGGVRVQLDVRALLPGVDPLVATKLLLFSPARPGYVPNHGFEVRAVTAQHGDVIKTLAPDEFLELDVGQQAGLRPVLQAAPGASQAAEDYEVVDLAGRAERLHERISYSFFSSAHAQYGAIGRPVAGADQADEPGPSDAEPPGGLVRISALGESTGRLWVVARDGRGAEAWMRLRFSFTDNRQCMLNLGNGTTVLNKCASLEIGCQ